MWYGGILPGFRVPKTTKVADVTVDNMPICVMAFGKNTFGQPISRPEGRNDYLISFISEGTVYETPQKIPLKNNSIILYKPHQPQIRYTNEDELATTYWIHFSGNKVEEILEKYNLDSGIITLEEPFYIFTDIIDRMYVAKNNPYWQDICNVLLLELLMHIGGRQNVDNTERNYKKLLAYMQETCSENLPIKVYADFIGFSEVYFIRFFKKASKKTPLAYLTNLKLEKACQMLIYTEKPVGQIGLEVGFKTARYFSKVFYEKYLLTPTQYRNNAKNK